MKLPIIILIVLVLAVSAGGYIYFNKSNRNLTAREQTGTSKSQANVDALELQPQTPENNVIINSATLSKNGFVVVRQVDDGKVSQVVEMSKPLKAGVNKNVTVPLTPEEKAGKELVVMLYEDYANDGVFNDLDMPLLTKDGLMTARFVATGKPLPASMTEAEMPAMNMQGMKSMVKVRYTDKGFVPEKVEIKVGDMVQFVNESNTTMWVASIPHPAHTKLPTFDQFRPFKKGAVYRYMFDKKGTWEFHDHLNPSLGGVVTVK